MMPLDWRGYQAGAIWNKSQAGVLSPKEEVFRRALEHDGFRITDLDGTLRRILPADARLPSAEDEITLLLDKHHLITAAGHLRQALDPSSPAWVPIHFHSVPA